MIPSKTKGSPPHRTPFFITLCTHTNSRDDSYQPILSLEHMTQLYANTINNFILTCVFSLNISGMRKRRIFQRAEAFDVLESSNLHHCIVAVNSHHKHWATSQFLSCKRLPAHMKCPSSLQLHALLHLDYGAAMQITSNPWPCFIVSGIARNFFICNHPQYDILINTIKKYSLINKWCILILLSP